MIKNIEVLIRLQSVSNKLKTINRNKKYLFNDVDESKEQIHKKKKEVEREENSLKSVQIRIDSKELDLKGVEDEINKYKVQLNQIKTNKEYSALTEEIRSKEADKSVIEDEVLGMMNELEAVKDNVQDLIDDTKKAEAQLSELIKTVEIDVKRIDDEVKEVEAKKNSLIETLNDQSRYHFERLIKNKNGIAVAEVLNYSCQCCNFTVTPQTINMLLSGRELVFCHSCGRILYLNNKERV